MRTPYKLSGTLFYWRYSMDFDTEDDRIPVELWKALLLASMTDDSAEFYNDYGPIWYDDYDEK